MKWILAGGTGLIGTALCKQLLAEGEQVWVLSRNPQPSGLPAGAEGWRWDGRTPDGWGHLVEEADYIACLAGENLGAGRWTASRKRAFYTSRVEPGQAIVEAVRRANHKPRAVLQASAVGYYGNSGDTVLTEQSPAGPDYLSQLVVDWENSTGGLEGLGLRRVITRTGIVLARGGEILNKFRLPFRFFVGGPLGSGRQWLPWIHLQDQISAMISLMRNESAQGVYNLTGPNPVRNAEFGKALGQVMRRPYWMPVPAFALRLALGEMSQMVLEGQRAVPARLLESGFSFKYPELEPALRDLLGKGK